MSTSLTDDLEHMRASDAAALMPAAGAFQNADAYDAFLEAYAVDRKNDKAAALEAAVTGDKVSGLTLSMIAYDGMRERVELGPTQAKSYFTGGLKERRAIGLRAIRESRWNVAREAALRVREGVSIDRLHPYEDKCLREFGAIAQDGDGKKRRRYREDGSFSMAYPEVLRENAFKPHEEFREDSFYDTGSGLGSDLSQPFGDRGYLDREWLNYSGPQGQQLYLNDVWDQAAKCFWAWHHDPVAQEACNIIRNFVIARGVTIEAADPKVQAIIDEFDTREEMKDRLKTWTVGLSRDGELFIRMIRVGDGRTRVRSLSPDTIWEIVTDAEDIESVYYYAQRYMTRTQLFAPPDGDAQHWVSRDLLASEVIHVKVNVAESEVRGRSDLFVVLAYLKMLRDLFATIVAKEQAQAAYQYDFTINGGSTDVTNFVSTALPKGKPQPGAYFAHNKAVEVKVLDSGKSASTSNGSSWEGLLTMIAIGIGVAKDYLGVTSRGSRATALVATEPSAMRFEERQDSIGTALTRLYNEVIAEARRYGFLDGVTDFSFKMTFPSIEKSDTTARVDLINQGVAMGYIGRKTAAGLYYSEMDIDDMDFDDQTRQIIAEWDAMIAAGHVPLILSKYAAIPMGDAATGALAADPADPAATAGNAPVAPGEPKPGGPAAPAATAAPKPGGPAKPAQGSSTQSPSSAAGAAAIKNDLGRGREVRESRAKRWRAYA